MQSQLWNAFGSIIVCTAAVLLQCGCGSGYREDSNVGVQLAQRSPMETLRKPDLAWKAETKEVGVIRLGKPGRGGVLANFCLHTNGNLLTCWSPEAKVAGVASANKGEVRVFSPKGEAVETWAVPLEPEAICCSPAGTIFVGGKGRLVKLDAAGKVFGEGTLPGGSRSGRQAVTGIGVLGDELFVAAPSPGDYSYTVYRCSTDLKDPTPIIKGLRGCCGQMDIQARDGKVWVAHNAKHKVEAYDHSGKLLNAFGKNDRVAADGFGGCCEPKNLRVAADGNVYAAESGPPVTIKRFSSEGKFLGLVGLPQFSSGCVRVAVEVSPDCKTFYILSTGENAIRVLAATE